MYSLMIRSTLDITILFIIRRCGTFSEDTLTIVDL